MFVAIDVAGRKDLVIRAQNFGVKSEPELIDMMESGKELPELNRNLYPYVEPYSTGILKVSDIHTIYWEQSGNPTGHVSGHLFTGLFIHFLCFALCNLKCCNWFVLLYAISMFHGSWICCIEFVVFMLCWSL